MATTIFANQALTSSGWQHNIAVSIDDNGRIADIYAATGNEEKKVGMLFNELWLA
jgi:hypothetical protein